MLPVSAKLLALCMWLSLNTYLLGDPVTQPAKSQAALEREARAQRTFHHWCEKFLNEASEMPPDTKLDLYPRDGKDYPVDIIRASYKIGDRNIRVTQARGVFSVKIEGVTVRDGEEGLRDIEQIAREMFVGADKVQMQWFDEKVSPKQGGSKPNQNELIAFVRTMAFYIDGTTVSFYTLKLVDAPQKMVVGSAISLNRNWFTITPEEADNRYNDDGNAAVRAAVLR